MFQNRAGGVNCGLRSYLAERAKAVRIISFRISQRPCKGGLPGPGGHGLAVKEPLSPAVPLVGNTVIPSKSSGSRVSGHQVL